MTRPTSWLSPTGPPKLSEQPARRPPSFATSILLPPAMYSCRLAPDQTYKAPNYLSESSTIRRETHHAEAPARAATSDSRPEQFQFTRHPARTKTQHPLIQAAWQQSHFLQPSNPQHCRTRATQPHNYWCWQTVCHVPIEPWDPEHRMLCKDQCSISHLLSVAEHGTVSQS